MKQIFSGEVYEILPIASGIVFSYKKEDVYNKVMVGYKMISFANGQYTDIAKNIYLLSKFNNNYKAILEHCENYIMVKALLLNARRTFLLFPDGKAALLDEDVNVVWSGDLLYRGNTPSDVKLYNNGLWATYPALNMLVKFNLNTMRPEIRLGNRKEPFSLPNDIFIQGDKAIISNSGSNKLISVNLIDYTINDLESFEESVKQYLCVDDKRLVVLDSGLYFLD